MMIPQKTLIKKKIHQTERELEKKRIKGGQMSLFTRPDEGPTSIAILAALRVTGTIVGTIMILIMFLASDSAVKSDIETVLIVLIIVGLQILPFTVGYGLWKLKSWAWKLYIVDIAVNVLLAVFILLLLTGNSYEFAQQVVSTTFSEMGPFIIFYFIIYSNREYFIN